MNFDEWGMIGHMIRITHTMNLMNDVWLVIWLDYSRHDFFMNDVWWVIWLDFFLRQWLKLMSTLAHIELCFHVMN